MTLPGPEIKPAPKPLKPVEDKVAKPVEDGNLPRPADSVNARLDRLLAAATAPSKALQVKPPQLKPTAARIPKPLDVHDNKVTDKFVRPIKFKKLARPPGKNNDLPDTRATEASMSVDTAKLILTLRAETAANEWFHSMSEREQEAYLRAHPGSKMAGDAGAHPALAAHALRSKDRHLAAALRHGGQAADLRGRGRHGAAVAYGRAASAHTTAAMHFHRAARHYAAGRPDNGRKHADLGARLASHVQKFEDRNRLGTATN